MGDSAAQRAFQKSRLKKRQKDDVARLFDSARHLHESGLLSDAKEIYRQLLKLEPSHFNALYLLGRLEYASQSYHEAEALLSRAVRANPQSTDAHLHLGLALNALQRFEDARASYRRAVALKPTDAAALNNLGNVCRNLNRLPEAIDSYDRAIAIRDDSAELHYNRGLALTDLRRYQEAIASFDRALAIDPLFAAALGGRGNALYWLRRLPEALDSLDRALAITPQNGAMWRNRAEYLLQMTRVADAIACCERALALQPEPPDPLVPFILGRCFTELGHISEAIASFDIALAIKPDFEMAISNKIFALDFAEDATFESQNDARRAWWTQIGAKVAARPPYRHARNRDPERRLVLGYVSSDFRDHSAGRAFKPVLRHHDRTLFETICYSCSARADDGGAEEFRQIADRWRNASQLSDERLAAQIREDGVDILIDLSGHTEGNRLGLFARKPAPIQVHAWGHVTPPGVPTIDYVFADPVSIPPEVRHLFCETIYDLPCSLTIEPLPAGVTHAETPALANGFVTYGVFNRINKITDAAATVWSRILLQVPRSRLLLKHYALDDPVVRGNLLARFARFGAPADRIDLMGSTTRLAHLAALNRVDICFDPFPHGGGASTWEALQMGVPVIAKLGKMQVARAAAAILTGAGLPDWVADGDDAYFDIAVAHASQTDALAQLRRALPARIAASAAGNPALYERAVATAYRAMWRNYCARGSD